MAWLQGLIQGFGALVANEDTSEGHQEYEEEEYEEEEYEREDRNGGDDDVVIPLYHHQLMYSTPEEANAAFVHAYTEFMTKHYERGAPMWRTDLFCNMYAFTLDGQRFWVLPTLHPITCVLENNEVPKVGFGKRNLGRNMYETDAVYDDETIQECMDSIVEWFDASGTPLQRRREPLAVLESITPAPPREGSKKVD
jgi:hypothetical protein